MNEIPLCSLMMKKTKKPSYEALMYRVSLISLILTTLLSLASVIVTALK